MVPFPKIQWSKMFASGGTWVECPPTFGNWKVGKKVLSAHEAFWIITF